MISFSYFSLEVGLVMLPLRDPIKWRLSFETSCCHISADKKMMLRTKSTLTFCKVGRRLIVDQVVVCCLVLIHIWGMLFGFLLVAWGEGCLGLSSKVSGSDCL